VREKIKQEMVMKKLVLLAGLAISGFLYAGTESIDHMVRVFKEHEKLSPKEQGRLERVLKRFASPSTTRVPVNTDLFRELKPFIKTPKNELLQRWLFTGCRMGDDEVVKFLINKKWVDINQVSGKGFSVLDVVYNSQQLSGRRWWIDYLEGKGAIRSCELPSKAGKGEARCRRRANAKRRALLQPMQVEVEEKPKKSVPWAEVIAAVVGAAQEQARLEQPVLEQDREQDKEKACGVETQEGDRGQEVLLADATECGNKPGDGSGEEFGYGKIGEIWYV
jgi:hypothetical protein